MNRNKRFVIWLIPAINISISNLIFYTYSNENKLFEILNDFSWINGILYFMLPIVIPFVLTIKKEHLNFKFILIPVSPILLANIIIILPEVIFLIKYNEYYSPYPMFYIYVSLITTVLTIIFSLVAIAIHNWNYSKK